MPENIIDTAAETPCSCSACTGKFEKASQQAGKAEPIFVDCLKDINVTIEKGSDPETRVFVLNGAPSVMPPGKPMECSNISDANMMKSPMIAGIFTRISPKFVRGTSIERDGKMVDVIGIRHHSEKAWGKTVDEGMPAVADARWVQ